MKKLSKDESEASDEEGDGVGYVSPISARVVRENAGRTKGITAL